MNRQLNPNPNRLEEDPSTAIFSNTFLIRKSSRVLRIQLNIMVTENCFSSKVQVFLADRRLLALKVIIKAVKSYFTRNKRICKYVKKWSAISIRINRWKVIYKNSYFNFSLCLLLKRTEQMTSNFLLSRMHVHFVQFSLCNVEISGCFSINMF